MNKTDLNSLKSLKKIVAIESYLEKSDLFKLLPVGCLDSFQLETYGHNIVVFEDELRDFLEKQNNIKYLRLRDRDFQDDLLGHLKLTHLTIGAFRCITSVIKHQHELMTHLDIVNAEIDDEGFFWICNNLKQLNVFKVNINDVTRSAFENIAKLENLQRVSLKTHKEADEGHIKVLSELKQSTIETLSLCFYHMNFCDKDFERLGENFRALRNLKFKRNHLLNLKIIFGKFRTLESLSLCCFHDSASLEFDGNFVNTSLKEFEFVRQSYEPNEALFKILEVLPNLKTLAVGGSCEYNTEMLETIFKSLSNVKSLRFLSCTPLNEKEFLMVLNKLGSKLNDILLNFHSHDVTIDEVLSIFEFNYSVQSARSIEAKSVTFTLKR